MATEKTALRFLRLLYEPYPRGEGLTCEIRTLAGPDEAESRSFGLSDRGLARSAAYAYEARDRADVYMGVLPRLGQGRYARDVRYAGWLWVDLDIGNGRREDLGCWRLFQQSGLPPPHMWVFSGSGGAHLYWRLGGAVGLPDDGARRAFNDVLKRLARKIGGQAPGPHADTAAADVARILRVPATLNRKHLSPPEVRLVLPATAPEARPLAWWQENLPLDPVISSQAAAAGRTARLESGFRRSAGGLDGWAERWASTPMAEGGRHKEMVSTARFLRREGGYTDAELKRLLLAKAAVSVGRHPISDVEVERMLTWA